MTKEKFAEMLNGRQYRNEIEKEESLIAEQNNLVVIFGASDDLLEFRGAIHEEIGAWDGTAVQICKKVKEWVVIENEEFQEEVEKISEYGLDLKGHEVEAIWSPEEPECSWLIKTEIPHATFDIIEDGELYCRGIVISLDSLN